METDINRKSPLFNTSVSACFSQSKGKQIISGLHLYFDKTFIIFRKFPQEGEKYLAKVSRKFSIAFLNIRIIIIGKDNLIL